jgi:hypothetical protein
VTVSFTGNAAALRRLPGVTAAFAGIATVGAAVVDKPRGVCILMNASASISPDHVAGLDEIHVRGSVSRADDRIARRSDGRLTTRARGRVYGRCLRNVPSALADNAGASKAELLLSPRSDRRRGPQRLPGVTAALTKIEPCDQAGSDLSGLLLWISRRPERHSAAGFSGGDHAEADAAWPQLAEGHARSGRVAHAVRPGTHPFDS